MQLTTAELSRVSDDEDAALEQHPEPEPFRPPARAEAPDDELPARLVQDAVIVRTDAAVVLLREVRVFSTGFELVLDWTLRRPLRFGLALPDGSKVTAPAPSFAMPTAQPEPPTAVTRQRGGGGSDRVATGSLRLWVWAPGGLRGELALVAEWTALGIAATAVALDGDAITDAAALVRPLWPAPARRSDPVLPAAPAARRAGAASGRTLLRLLGSIQDGIGDPCLNRGRMPESGRVHETDGAE